MAIDLAPEPAGVRDAAVAGLRAFLSSEAEGTHLAGPIPVFDLAPGDLRGGRGPAATRLTAQGYVVTNGAAAVTHAVEVLPDERGGFRLGNVTSGYARGMDAALARAEAAPVVGKSAVRFELAVLRVPPLRLLALWFRSANPDTTPDQFLAVEPSEFPTGDPIAADDFWSRVRSATEMYVTQVTPPPPPRGVG